MCEQRCEGEEREASCVSKGVREKRERHHVLSKGVREKRERHRVRAKVRERRGRGIVCEQRCEREREKRERHHV